MPANTGADKFAGARKVREGGAYGGSRPAEAAPIPFKSGKNLDGAKLFISFFLSAILLPHSNNARGRGIEEKGERSQANWIRMLQDRKDL